MILRSQQASSGSASSSTFLERIRRVSFLDAIQAMSAAAHCGEMDDIHGGAGTCIGGMIVPALVAMAEKYGRQRPRVFSRAPSSGMKRRPASGWRLMLRVFSFAAGGRARCAEFSASPQPVRSFCDGL